MVAIDRKRWVPVSVLVVGLLVSYAVVTGKPKPEAGPIPEAPRAVVDVVRVQPGDQTLTIQTQGSVTPRREIDLVAQVSGVVSMVADQFVDGGFFSQGESLLVIEDADYRFALTRAEAKVADARQVLATEKGRARQAKREWRNLGDQESNDLFLRKPQLAAAEAALRSAIADRDKAELDLKRTRISVPFNGRVMETKVDLGQYVAPGTPVARVYSTDVLEVRLPLTDRQVALLDLPLNYRDSSNGWQPIPVTLTGEFGRQQWQWDGEITRTEASIDVESRVVYAVAEVVDPFVSVPGLERPPLSVGQFVEAQIASRILNDVIVLPRQALRLEDKVWIMDAQENLRVIDVDVIQSDSQQAAVRGEFSPGDRVIVSNLTVAVDGMPIRARSAEIVVGGTL